MADSNPASTAITTTSTTASKVTVRTYLPKDQKDATRLYVEGASVYAAIKGQGETNWTGYIQDSCKTDLAHIEDVYFAPGGCFWVATMIENGEEVVVGSVGAEWKPGREIELRRMFVSASHHRFGIGRLLISTLESWAREQEASKVWLSTPGVATKAHKFYHSMGFTFLRAEICPFDFEIHFYEKVL